MKSRLRSWAQARRLIAAFAFLLIAGLMVAPVLSFVRPASAQTAITVTTDEE